MEFLIPKFEVWQVVYTAIGAALLWGKWGRTKLRVYILSSLLDIVSFSPAWRAFVEFLIFVILGCTVGIGLTEPNNAAQALTAGLGWTGLFAYHPKAT